MELNIDLLPQPKKKRYDLIVICIVLAGLLLGGGYFGTSLFIQLKAEQRELQAELAALEELKGTVLEKERLNQESITQDNYLSYWEQFSQLVERYRLESYAIITSIQDVLPNHARIQSVSLESGGKLTLEGTFSRMEDIAGYLDRVLQLPEVQDAQVGKIFRLRPTNLEEPIAGTEDTGTEDQEITEQGIEESMQESPKENYLVEYILTVQRVGAEK